MIATSHNATAAALERALWRRDAGGGRPGFVLPPCRASLCRLEERAEWECYELRSPLLPAPRAARALHANATLRGPAKWVVAAEGAIQCRVDVPREWTAVAKRQGAQRGNGDDLGPQQTWATALTRLAAGQSSSAATAAIELEATCELLQRLGRTASIDGSLLRTHAQLPDLYREIAISSDGSGVRVAAELIDLRELTGAARRAAYAFAAVANARLPLVRLTILRDKAAAPLWAEVVVGSSGAAVSPAWIVTAVDAVETAVELCARELAALADPALAERVLAALAAETLEKELCDACQNA